MENLWFIFGFVGCVAILLANIMPYKWHVDFIMYYTGIGCIVVQFLYSNLDTIEWIIAGIVLGLCSVAWGYFKSKANKMDKEISKILG